MTHNDACEVLKIGINNDHEGNRNDTSYKPNAITEHVYLNISVE